MYMELIMPLKKEIYDRICLERGLNPNPKPKLSAQQIYEICFTDYTRRSK